MGMTNLEEARAMKCLGRLLEYAELDPDPAAQENLQREFNCGGCESLEYCQQLTATLS